MKDIRKLLTLTIPLTVVLIAYPVSSLTIPSNQRGPQSSVDLVLGNPSNATTDTDDNDATCAFRADKPNLACARRDGVYSGRRRLQGHTLGHGNSQFWSDDISPGEDDYQAR